MLGHGDGKQHARRRAADSGTGRPASSSIRGHWREHKGEVILLGLATLVAGAVVALAVSLLAAKGPGGQIEAPSAISTPEDLGAYVRTQPIWGGAPAVFKSQLSAAIREQGSPTKPASVQLDPAGTDLEAHSVAYFADNGAMLQESVVMVVGRVRTASPIFRA